MMVRVLMACVALACLSGCATINNILGGGAKLEAVEMTTDPPAQVAVFMTAETGDEPLDELMSSSFEIYEDGQLVDPSKSQQTLLEPDRVAAFHTLLLLDLSGDAASRQNRTALARATATFVENVRRTQPVTIYAFDGAASPVLLAHYPKLPNGPPLGTIPEVERFQTRDASRDLRSSVIDALKQLNARLMQKAKPIQVGTLVVFTQGPDLAGRVEEEDYYGHVDTTKRDIVVIHMAEDPDHEIERLGNHGLIQLDALPNAGPVFERAAMRVRDLKDRHYLLSYCSPSRAGKRILRIDVTGYDEEGNEKTDNLQLEFDSTGFGPGCDANDTPSFSASPGSDSPPEPPAAATPGTEPATTPPEPGPDDAVDDEPEPGEDGIVPPPDRPGYGD